MPIAKLDNAPRCRHVKADGSTCKAPALRRLDFCHFHLNVYSPSRAPALPVVEDALSLQLAIHQVLRALVQGTLDRKTCATILYGLQIAASNLKRLALERETIDAEAEGQRQQSLAELLLEKLELVPDPRLEEEEDGTHPPSPSQSEGSAAAPSALIPEIHACAGEPQPHHSLSSNTRASAFARSCSRTLVSLSTARNHHRPITPDYLFPAQPSR